MKLEGKSWRGKRKHVTSRSKLPCFAAGKKWRGTKTRKPPFAHTTFAQFPSTLKRDIDWRVEGNLQDVYVSTELLRNH
jgi:hypothetical protein